MADQNQALSSTPPKEIVKSSCDQTDASAKVIWQPFLHTTLWLVWMTELAPRARHGKSNTYQSCCGQGSPIGAPWSGFEPRLPALGSNTSYPHWDKKSVHWLHIEAVVLFKQGLKHNTCLEVNHNLVSHVGHTYTQSAWTWKMMIHWLYTYCSLLAVTFDNLYVVLFRVVFLLKLSFGYYLMCLTDDWELAD